MTQATSLPSQQTPTTPIGDDELYEVVNGRRIIEPDERSPDEDTLYEIVNGQRVEKPPMGFYECRIAALLCYYLEHFARAQQLGRACVEALFRLVNGGAIERRPDVAFVSYQRWPKARKMPRAKAWDVVPDLAVEVISRTNFAEDVLVKVHEYLRAGVQRVWVIYPVLGQVHVHESPTAIRIYDRQGELDGGSILPGFRLPVAALFEDELEQEEASVSE
jgi:Uma2 family endonuclease